MERSGVSHFLQVIIMVALVATLGLMMYSGALQLFSGWGTYRNVIIRGAYKIGDNLTLVLSNTGSSLLEIKGIDIYKPSASLIDSWEGLIKLQPGESYKINIENIKNVNPGDDVEIVITLSDETVFKYRVTVQ